MKNSKKENKKKYYIQNTKNDKRRGEILDTLTGIIITTDKNKEKNCVKDAYNILNDAVEIIYPDLLKKVNHNEESCNRDADENSSKAEKKQKISENEQIVTKKSNISDLLEHELINLRAKSTKLFYNFETNCKGVVFIKIEKKFREELDTKKLVSHIINNVKKTKEQLSKNIARFLPVEIAMKAKFDVFQKHAPTILNKYFKDVNHNDEKLTWRLEFKQRNNNSVHREEYLQYLLNFFDKEKFRVDFKNSKFVVLIEITNDLLCLSVLEDYNENKCYNLLTLSKSEEELKREREKLLMIQHQRELEKNKIEEKEVLQIEEAVNKIDENEILNNNSVKEEDSDIDII